MTAARPTLADEWNLEEWRVFRSQQLEALARFSEAWANNVGRGLVAMADHHIARLEAA